MLTNSSTVHDGKIIKHDVTDKTYASDGTVINDQPLYTLIEEVISDNVGVTDSIDGSEPIVEVGDFSETVGISDSININFIYAQSISNNVEISDSIETAITYGINISDTIGVTDSLSEAAGPSVTISDTVGLTDLLTNHVPVSQEVIFQYGQAAKAEEFNKINHKLYPTGIYSGGTMVKDTDYTFHVEPFIAFIKDSLDNLSVVVETTENIPLPLDISKPYVVLRMVWQNVDNNYVDILQVDYNNIQSYDVILGRPVFSGGLLTSNFDYSKQDNPVFPDLHANRFNLKVFVNSPPSNKVYVNPGNLFHLNKSIEFTGGNTSEITDTILGRHDLVYIDIDGNVQVEEGIDSATPVTPNYNGKLVLAEIRRMGTKNVILGDEVFNNYYDKFYPQELGLLTENNGASLIGMGGDNNLTETLGTNLEDYTLNLLNFYRTTADYYKQDIPNGEPVGYNWLDDSINRAGHFYRQHKTDADVTNPISEALFWYNNNLVATTYSDGCIILPGKVSFYDLNPDGEIQAFSPNNGLDFTSTYSLARSTPVTPVGDGVTVNEWVVAFQENTNGYPVVSVGSFDGSNNIVLDDVQVVNSSSCSGQILDVIGYGTNQFAVRINNGWRFGHVSAGSIVWDTTYQTFTYGNYIWGTVNNNTVILTGSQANEYQAYTSSGSTITELRNRQSIPSIPTSPTSLSAGGAKVYSDDLIMIILSGSGDTVISRYKWNTGTNYLEATGTNYASPEVICGTPANIPTGITTIPRYHLFSNNSISIESDTSEDSILFAYNSYYIMEYNVETDYMKSVKDLSYGASSKYWCGIVFATDSNNNWHLYGNDSSYNFVEIVPIPYLGILDKSRKDLEAKQTSSTNDLLSYATESDDMEVQYTLSFISLEGSNLYAQLAHARTANTPYVYANYIFLFEILPDTFETTLLDIYEFTDYSTSAQFLCYWSGNKFVYSQVYVNGGNDFRLHLMSVNENKKLVLEDTSYFTDGNNYNFYSPTKIDNDYFCTITRYGSTSSFAKLQVWTYSESDGFQAVDTTSQLSVYYYQANVVTLGDGNIGVFGRVPSYNDLYICNFDMSTSTVSILDEYQFGVTNSGRPTHISRYTDNKFLLYYGDSTDKSYLRIGHYDGYSEIAWDTDAFCLDDEIEFFETNNAYYFVYPVNYEDSSEIVLFAYNYGGSGHYIGIVDYNGDSTISVTSFLRNIEDLLATYGNSALSNQIAMAPDNTLYIGDYSSNDTVVLKIDSRSLATKANIVVYGYNSNMENLNPGQFYGLDSTTKYNNSEISNHFSLGEVTTGNFSLKALSYNTMLLGISHKPL